MKTDKKALYHQIAVLAFPVMLQSLLSNVLSTTDTAMIGRIGQDAISGVAIANKLFSVYMLILFGLSNGFGIYMSQFSQSQKRSKLSDIFNFGMRMSVLVSLASAAVMALFGHSLLTLYVKNTEVIAIGYHYLTILIFSCIFLAFTNMFSVIYRILGHARIPAYASSVSVFVNIILNYVLIFGKAGFPVMGITGAGIATVAARVTECMILILKKKEYLQEIKISLKYELSPDMKWTVLKNAMLLMTNEFIWSLGLNVVFMNYGYAGEEYIPAITVVDNINNLIYIVSGGFCTAVSILVGQTLGAGLLSETRENVKEFLKISVLIYVAGGAFLIATSNITPGFFSLESDNLRMASRMLVVKSLLGWSNGYTMTVYYVLRAGGDNASVLTVDGAFTWYGLALCSFVFSHLLGSDVFVTYVAVEAMGLVKVAIATYFLKKERWLRSLA